MTGPNRAIFFDRDGVLNRAVVRDGKPYPPANVSELDIPEDVPAVLESVRKLGFVLIGVSNQPDVARGTTPREAVEAINRKLLESVPLAEMLVCYHDDCDRCECRKPLPGLLLEGAAKYQVDLASSFMIGDRWRDVEAGRRAGCTTIWIDYGYSEKWPVAAPDHTVKSLAEAIEYVVQTTQDHVNSCKQKK